MAKKEFKLTRIDEEVFYFLLQGFEEDENRWYSKQELLDNIPSLKAGKTTSHDICSTLNTIRLKINRAAHEGIINHIVLLDNNRFKLAKDKEEAEKYFKRDFDNAMKLLARYWHNIGVVKKDGQGRLIDCNGDVITEESLAKRFYAPFGV